MARYFFAPADFLARSRKCRKNDFSRSSLIHFAIVKDPGQSRSRTIIFFKDNIFSLM